MKTPIADSVRSADHLIDTARRLETDRAALMEALETADFYMREHGIHLPNPARVKVRAALNTARANFPQP